MVTKIGIIRGANLEEIQAKRFNIYVGVSLGNKWFTKDHIKESILWALKHTKEKVGVLIADKLHAINYEVLNDEKPGKATKRALKQGDKFVAMINEILSELPNDVQTRLMLLGGWILKPIRSIKNSCLFFTKNLMKTWRLSKKYTA